MTLIKITTGPKNNNFTKLTMASNIKIKYLYLVTQTVLEIKDVELKTKWQNDKVLTLSVTDIQYVVIARKEKEHL